MENRLPEKSQKLAHTRIPETISIRTSDIVVGPFEHDPQFHDLYQRYRKGQLRTALTRIHASDISTGFYRYCEGRSEQVSNLDQKLVDAVMARIRRGARPILMVYWNPICPKPSKYVCADDEVALAAYLKLKIDLVPCLVLKPKDVVASEAAIWTQAKFKKDEEEVRLLRSIAPKVDAFATLHFEGELSFVDLLEALISVCSQTRQRVREFHSGAPITNYHHVLHATLRRHERILDSIGKLASLDRMEHAIALVRVAYEAFLNFYVDWISPAFFGPRLQFLAKVRRASIFRGIKPESHPDIGVLTNFVEFLSRVSDKARISPLGAEFHRRIYPSLSLVVHQSYESMEIEANDFLDESTQDLGDEIRHYGQCLNVITTALVKRVRNEVGIF